MLNAFIEITPSDLMKYQVDNVIGGLQMIDREEADDKIIAVLLATKRNLRRPARNAWAHDVADAAVADTHALLFHTSSSHALGRRAASHVAACEAQQAIVYVPAAVMWEVAALSRGRRAIDRPAAHDSRPSHPGVRSGSRAVVTSPTYCCDFFCAASRSFDRSPERMFDIA